MPVLRRVCNRPKHQYPTHPSTSVSIVSLPRIMGTGKLQLKCTVFVLLYLLFHSANTMEKSALYL